MPRPSRLAKLSAPQVARILPRPRLFRRLDPSRGRRVLWIVAQPGAGKTALLASWLSQRKLRHLWIQLDEGDGDVATFFHYLALAAERLGRKRDRLPTFTPECLAAPGGFARRFFRALCAGARPPSVIALDDYHEVRPDSPLHAALRDGLCELPDGVTVVVASRAEPPPALARLRANGSLQVLRGDSLTLSASDAEGIAGLWGYSRRDRPLVLAFHARTEGWAAGLVLLFSWQTETGSRHGGGEEQALFEYFAEEVLARADADTRTVLLETAFLPRVAGSMAVRLTGVARSSEILADLARRGYFVVRHEAASPTYKYHALFQEFLRRRAERTLPAVRRDELRLSAARVLEESGQVEDALQLCFHAGAWAWASPVIVSHAPALLRDGRAETVAGWVLGVPEEIRARDPWLLHYLGAALSILDPQRAVGHLERALELFLAADDARGVFLSWVAIAETHLYVIEDMGPLDRWISVLDDLRARFPRFPGLEVEQRMVAAVFGALSHRQPWHPALRSWGERALALALSPGDAHLRMKIARVLTLYYGGWVIDLDKARIVSEAMRPLAAARRTDPATAIFWYAGDAVHQLHVGRVDTCLAMVERGLALAAESGLQFADAILLQLRVLAAVMAGDLAAAEVALRQMGAGELEGRFSSMAYHHAACLLALRRGEYAAARQHGRICRELVAAVGSPHIELIFGLACVLAGPPESIETELAKMAHQARRCGARLIEAGSLLALALAAIRQGDEARAVAPLRDGLAAARALGCYHFVWFEPAELADCCAVAIEHGIEPGYVRELIRVRRLAPGKLASALETWPWDLRIRALGGLTVTRAGEPLRAGRKAQKKPLEMLRLLVAHGERGVRQELLAGQLWPDAEGDAAHRALKTTVYRLRKLLGKYEAVAQLEGRVALDPRFVFVDAWAVERLLDRARAQAPAGSAVSSRPGGLRERIEDLYRGDLFGEEGDEPSLAHARERLRKRVEPWLRAS